MAKVNPVLESKVVGSSGTDVQNLSLIKSTTPSQSLTNAVKPNDGQLLARTRGKARTGAGTQSRNDDRLSTASPQPKMKRDVSTSALLINRDRRIDPATAARGTTPEQLQLDQTPAAVMARTNPTTELLNSAVRRFYQEASGGLAARSNRDMVGPLREVAELKDQLAAVIRNSAAFVAANSAKCPALGKWRQGLIDSLGSIDSWLKSANAYAAGLTGPGGKHTATPVLVQPPNVVLSSSVSLRSAKQEAADIWQQYRRANRVITQT